MVAYEAREGQVVSLLFDRSYGWTRTRALSWAKSHGFHPSDVTPTANYIHLGFVRVQYPIRGRIRTVHFGDGIEARIRFTGLRRGVSEPTQGYWVIDKTPNLRHPLVYAPPGGFKTKREAVNYGDRLGVPFEVRKGPRP